MFTTLISLNRFNFLWKLTLNKNLEKIESRKYIRFHNKKIIPYMFLMCIYKNNKVNKTIREKNRNKAPNIAKD